MDAFQTPAIQPKRLEIPESFQPRSLENQDWSPNERKQIKNALWLLHCAYEGSEHPIVKQISSVNIKRISDYEKYILEAEYNAGIAGFVKPDISDEMSISSHLLEDPIDLANTIAHELRHCWQNSPNSNFKELELSNYPIRSSQILHPDLREHAYESKQEIDACEQQKDALLRIRDNTNACTSSENQLSLNRCLNPKIRKN